MAAQDLSAVTNALAQNYPDRVIRTVNRRSVLLTMLEVRKGSGKNVPWDFEASGQSAENFSDGADVSTYASDALYPATLSWSLARSNFQITDLAQAAAGSSLSPSDLGNLLMRNSENAVRKVASFINAQLFSGDGTSQSIVGLDNALKDDNTYAGIDRTSGTYSLFRANVIDSASATLTLSQIRSDINDTIYSQCGEQPDIAICSPAVFNKVGALFEETRRRVSEVSQTNVRGQQIMLDGSLGAIEFEGCLFFKDKDATANTIYYLNSNYVHIEYLQQAMPAFVLNEQTGELEIGDGFGTTPLGMKFVELGRTGAARKMTAQVFLQLVVERPNACGRRKNIG